MSCPVYSLPLAAQVIREIIAKYGLKERELAARLLSKYGRPLPRSVSNQELRKVLADFGMQDEDPATQRAEHAPATSAAKSTLSTPSTSSVGGAKGLDSSGEAAAAAARGRSCAAGPGRSERYVRARRGRSTMLRRVDRQSLVGDDEFTPRVGHRIA